MEEMTKTANNLADLGGSLCLVRCEVFRVSMETATIFWVVIMRSLLISVLSVPVFYRILLASCVVLLACNYDTSHMTANFMPLFVF